MFDRITREEIEECFDRGVREGYAFLVIYNDSFNYDYFPNLFKTAEEFWEVNEDLINRRDTWTSIEEVYDLSLDKQSQMAEFRARHYPPKPQKQKKKK